jgi:hypothetical protein
MRQRVLWAAVAALLAIVVGAFRFLAIAGLSNDHYMHLAAGQQIAMGEWPTRDYVELGLPLMEAISAIPFLVLPDAPLFAEAVLIAVMFAIGAVFTLYGARHLTGSLWIALVVVALEVMIFPRTYGYPKVVAYACGFLAMWRYAEQPKRVVELAIAIVVAFGLRYDHGIYVGVGGLLTVLLTRASNGVKVVVRQTLIFAGVLLLFLAPYLLFLSYYDGLWRHIMRGVELQRVESARGRTIPSFTFDHGVFTSNAEPWLFFLFHALPVIAAVVLWVRRHQEGSQRERTMVVPLLVVALLVDVGLIRDTVSARLPDAIVPAALLIGWLLSVAMRVRPVPVRMVTWAATAAMVVLTMTSAAAIGGTKEQLEKAEMLGSPARLLDHFGTRAAEFHQRFPLTQMPSRVASTLVPFFAYVDRCFGPTDHILVPAYAPEIAVWARRPFAGGEVWFQPGLLRNPEDDRQVMSRLAEQRVPAAILLSPSAPQVIAHFPELARYISGHFTERIPLRTDDGRDLVIAFNPQIAVGVDRETGWYCYR